MGLFNKIKNIFKTENIEENVEQLSINLEKVNRSQ